MLTYRIDFVTNVTDVRMDEYFYNDIVSVATSTEKNVVEKGAVPERDVTVDVENFKITTTGGTIAKCSIAVLNESVQQSITAMKHLLRDKKNR